MAPPKDTTAPAIANSKIGGVVRNRSVTVTATSNEAGSMRATGTIAVGNTSRTYRLKGATKSVAAGKRATLRLKIPKRAFNALKRTFRRAGRKARVRISLACTDPAGNRSATKRVRKRVRPARGSRS